MKLQQTPSFNLNEQIKGSKPQPAQPTIATPTQPSFKGAEFITTGMNFIQNSPAVGATLIDVGCMGAPRTIIDTTRSPEAGLETARREFISTGNDALLGVYGMGAAAILAHGFNKEYGEIKANKLFINDDAVDVYSQIWTDKAPKAQAAHAATAEIKDASPAHIDAFLKEAVANLKGYNPKSVTAEAEDAWMALDNKAQSEIVEVLKKELEKPELKLEKTSKEYIKAVITKSTEAEDKFKIGYKGFTTEASLDETIDGLFKMTKTLKNGKVAEAFRKSANVADNLFVKGLKSLNNKTAIWGLGASLVIGLSAQPFNAYLTKKKTGKSDFVGGGGENKSNGFKLVKLLSAATAGSLAMLAIGKSKKEILKNLQFKSLIPTLNQFKLVYGATIVSRLLFARNENELRESAFKDTLGFVNWLILGGFVSKFTAAAFEKASKVTGDKYIRYNENVNGKGFFKWLTESSTITRKEALMEAYNNKTLNLSPFSADGKTAKTMKEMLVELKQIAKGTSQEQAKVAAHALKKVRNLGVIQLAGYAYSGIVLGVLIPKANIAMTKAFSKDKKDTNELPKIVPDKKVAA